MNNQQIERRIEYIKEMMDYTKYRLNELKKQVKIDGCVTDRVKKQRETIYQLRSSYRKEMIELANELFKLEPIEE